MVCAALEGVAATVFLPALMSLLLGVVPDRELGSVLLTVLAGVIAGVAYPNVEGIFYLLGAGGVAAAVFVMLIPAETIKHKRARQAVVTVESITVDSTPSITGAVDGEGGSDAPRQRAAAAASHTRYSRYSELFRSRGIVALLTFMYHLSNAGVTPLVTQLIAHEDERTGLVFTSAVLCIFYF
ncbi:hypothetical protein EMIHUDRAFT_220879, partial [Emiliania huxleyi CCMP1516]